MKRKKTYRAKEKSKQILHIDNISVDVAKLINFAEHKKIIFTKTFASLL